MTDRLTQSQRERLAAQSPFGNARIERQSSRWVVLNITLAILIALILGFKFGYDYGVRRVIAQRDAAIKELAVLRATYQWTKETLSK